MKEKLSRNIKEKIQGSMLPSHKENKALWTGLEKGFLWLKVILAVLKKP